MCGIVGLAALEGLDKTLEKPRQEAMRFLLTEILQQTSERGEDATGVATLFADGGYVGQKMPISSPEFVSRFGGKRDDYEGYIKSWRKHTSPASIVLGHCRKSSVGNAWDNVNNHPIKTGEIVGVHNGTLLNHEVIFHKLKKMGQGRDGTVDSEAIMRLLRVFSEDGKIPFTIEMLQEVVRRLDGGYSVLSFSGNNPYQLVAMKNQRPMEFALLKPLNLLIVASTTTYIKNALHRLLKQITLYDAGHDIPKFNLKDIEFDTLPERTVALFNLTHKITEETKIEDLFESDDITMSVNDKIWRNGYNETTQSAKAKKKAAKTTKGPKSAKDSAAAFTEVDSKPAGGPASSASSDDKEDKADGSVYNSSLGKYVKATKKAEDDVIDAEHTVITTRDKPESEALKITEEKKDDDAVDKDAISGEISEIESLVNKDQKKDVLEKRVVEMDIDPDAISGAEGAIKDLQKYSNDAEILDDLELTKSSADIMPIFSLANRIRIAAFKTGYYLGFTKAKETPKESAEIKPEKSKKAQKNIRVLKTMSNVLSRILGTSKIAAIDSGVLDRVVKKSLADKDDIDSDTLTKIFTPEDLRKHPVIRQVRDHVQSIELADSTEQSKE